VASSVSVRILFSFILLTLSVVSVNSEAEAARRAGDRFGLRVGAWPQNDVSGVLAEFVQFSNDPDTIYRAVIEEDGHVAPFLELYGLFNIRGMWWLEIAAGFSQRTNVQVDGIRVTPPLPPNAPKGDSAATKILLGDGRVDFIPLFVGARAVKELGTSARPHNLYGRGGISMLVASEQPNAIHPHIGRGAYSQGTKAAFGILIGGGGEYYLGRRFGLVGDIAYRLSDLNYTDDGDYDLSGIWASFGATLRIR
jgi:hypothetical protein